MKLSPPSSFLLLFALLLAANASAQHHHQSSKGHTTAPSAAAASAADAWADNRMALMSLDEKVGQMLFLRVPSNMTPKKQREFEKLVRSHHPGGVCFFKGSAQQQVALTRRLQQVSDVPLMVSIDAEWGLGMRLTDCYSFPRQMLMGALSPDNDSLIVEFAEEVARQCRMMGIHVNFAPVADINSNPANPVIGCRSFGENKRRVAKKALFYASALQHGGVIAVGKHFPGHGDTDVDSHDELPLISHSKQYVDSVDLYPFAMLAKHGIRGIMVAHLQVNAYDNRVHMPSSLSERIVGPLLRDRMHFDGLVFTDGIDMKGVANYYKDGEGAIRAIRAGSDVILLPVDVDMTMNAIVKEAKEDPAFAQMIDNRCHRILREKYRSGLDKPQACHAPGHQDYERASRIAYAMAVKALTLVKNDDYALPLEEDRKVVTLELGNSKNAITSLDDNTLASIAEAGTVVMHLYANVAPANNYGVSSQSLDVINSIAAMNEVKSVLVVYGSPYILELFAQPLPTNRKASQNAANAIQNAINDYPQRPDAIVMAYQDLAEVRRAVPLALSGVNAFEGRLPVSAGNFSEGTSLRATPRPSQLSPYARLAAAGMREENFRRIDSLALDGIAQHAYPGCQLLVARGGTIVYNRCYGHLSYDANAPLVDSNTMYDIASLTKVTATTPSVMMLVDAGKVSLDDPISRYVPYLKGTNKSKITVRAALSHYARLKSFDAYWKEASTDGSLMSASSAPEGFTAIGDSLYISDKYRDVVLKQIAKSDLNKKKGYVYSDLGFILLAEMVRYVSGQSIDIFAYQHLFKPLHMNSTTFQPLQHGYDVARIAPTETETTFRKQTLRGYVHDPNAAAMGGVAGHAGLFSTASDLFRIYQMMLNEGTYHNHEYISVETFRTFNSRHYADKGNRRALGFDKPFISSPSTHVSPRASQESFGHTGFTGTMVWVDPQYDLIYIFLSNRVHPSATPNKLAAMNIRTNIQEEIYRSME
ncbi:MAG: serine hydrolase [Bacteroidales bacterium]|nr:serine hydrolase [Bacteroidales bacterium]